MELIDTIAGTGTGGFSGDGGPATAARVRGVDGFAYDSSGNLYFSDTFNNRIRRIDAVTGVITTIAGTGEWNFSGDGGAATLATLRYPRGLAFDSDDNLYISDYYSHRIRRIDALSGIITTVAGSNVEGGFSGDGGLATNARIHYAHSIAIDSDDNLFIADTNNHRIRRVDADTDIITTISGTGTGGFTGDGVHASLAQLNAPTDIAFDSADNLLIADYWNHRIRRIDAISGDISTIAGNGIAGFDGDGGPASDAQLWTPSGVALDSSDNLYIVDYRNNRIRWVDSATNDITTVAGDGTTAYNGDGIPGPTASLHGVHRMAVAPNGDVVMGDVGHHRIRRLGATSQGEIAGTLSTEGTGAPIAGYELDLYAVGGSILARTTTGSTGNFNFSALPPGDYEVGFVDSSNLHLPEWFDDSSIRATATTITVNDDTHNADAALIYSPAVVSGTVVQDGTGLPLADIEVTAYLADGEEYASTTTAADGTYQFELPQLDFEIWFETSAIGLLGPGSSEWYNNAWDRADADVVSPILGTTTTVDASMAWPGTLSGTVTDESTGLPLAGIQVRLYFDGLYYVGTTTTAADGSYVVPQLWPGLKVRVRFVDPAGTYSPEWWNDVGDPDSATRLTTSGRVGFAGIDAALSSATTASISGTVTHELAGTPEAGIDVTLYEAWWNGAVPIATDITAADGTYSFSNLDPESYVVSFSGSSIVTEWWMDGSSRGKSTVIDATAGGPIVADAEVAPFGSLSGTVVDSTDTSLAGIVVNVHLPDGPRVATTTSADDGSYLVPTLTDGDYQVRFFHPLTASTIEWWDDAPDQGSSDPITINRGATSTADATLAIDPLPIIDTVAGTGTHGYNGDNIAADTAYLRYPSGVAIDSAGNLFLSDRGSHRIRRVDAITGVITTVAGTGTGGFSGDDESAIDAKLQNPTGITFDADDNLYIADTGNARVRRVDALTQDITTVAGSSSGGGQVDGILATNTSLGEVSDVQVDTDGNLYLSDGAYNHIRRVDAVSGLITTIAGSSGFSEGFSGDGGPATDAKLAQPRGIALDSTNNLYIADRNNDRIRRVDAVTGIITTVAGKGVGGFSADYVPATTARLNNPRGIAIDADDNLIIADDDNHRVRRVDAITGIITTIAGTGPTVFNGDNRAAVTATIQGPRDVAIDPSGRIYIADFNQHRVRRIDAS